MRKIGRFVLAVMLILVLGVAGTMLWARLTLPSHSGSVTLTGLKAPVEITWEEHGIPTIRAQNVEDGYFALGYVHAQDRLFQMELQRRYGAGRLAEIVGPDALRVDRQMRVFGFHHLAEQELIHVAPDFHQVLDAYAAGVNAWIREGHRLPVEFYLLHIRPEWWSPVDTLVYGKLLALELSGNYRRELERGHLAQKLSPENLAIALPDYPRDGPIALPKLAALYRGLPFGKMLGAMPDQIGPTAASNDWVLDGKHSVTGKPLLANDPHLGYSMPSIWYLARLELPGVSIAGGTMAGTPLFILGHNRRVAWGYTTTNADVEDLFIEKIDPKDPGRYLTPDGSAPFETRQEIIHVRAKPDEKMTIRSTRHGVVLSDAGPNAIPDAGTKPDEVLALQATFLSAEDNSAEAQWRVDLATNWPQFVNALTEFTAPAQNIVYADVDGNIGFYVPGRIPIRKAGDGRVPVPGWSGAYDWTGWIPFEALPHVFNPPAGHVATANNKIVPDDYPYLITKDWELPYRAQRIEALLKAEPRQSIDTSAAIQRDVVSLSAEQLLPSLLAVPARAGRQQQVHDLLATWDHGMRAGEAAPLVYAAWVEALTSRLEALKMGDDHSGFAGFNPLFISAALRPDASWCPAEAKAAPNCASIVSAALDEALRQITQLQGTDMAQWKWGGVHQVVFAHPVFGRIPWVKEIFNRVITDGGGIDTVHAGGYYGSPPAPYADVHGPGLRAVYDLADLDRSVFMIGPGQSEEFLSEHYADLLRPWQRGDWLSLPGNAEGTTLRLEPRSSSPN